MTQSDAFSRYLTAPDRRLAAEYEKVITLPYLVLADIVRLPCTMYVQQSGLVLPVVFNYKSTSSVRV